MIFIIYKIIIGYNGVSIFTFIFGVALYIIGIAFLTKEILGKKELDKL